MSGGGAADPPAPGGAPGGGTWAASAGRRPEWTRPPGAAASVVNPAVWRASTILFDDAAALARGAADMGRELYYGRKGGPTHWALAEALTALEPGAAGTLLFPSGVAALAGLFLATLEPGAHMLVTDSAYDPTTAMLAGLFQRWGVEAEPYGPRVGGGIARLFRPATRLVLMESPGSLSFEVQDVPAIAAAARAAGIVSALDNTWAASVLFRGLPAGVDVVMQSLTKYAAGHADVLMGSLSAAQPLFARLQQTSWAMGQIVSADDAALVLRGLRTLPLRLQRSGESGLAVARWLERRPQVARLVHPALPSHPDHGLFARDFSGAAGLFGVELAGGGGRAAAEAFVARLARFGMGFSWGGFESLALPAEPDRLRRVAPPRFAGPYLRLAIGLEEPADLIDDLARALAAIA